MNNRDGVLVKAIFRKDPPMVRPNSRDRELRGGTGMNYRLHIGDLPVVTNIFPSFDRAS